MGSRGKTAPRVLIVEDELLISINLARSLESLGYEVVGEVSTGEEAVEKANETRPDLVLMDIMLGGEMDGIQAAERVRFGLDIPVVYVTGYAEKDVLARAKLTDPYGYLAKPIAFHELRNVIETALYKHEMYRRIRDSEEKYRLLVDHAPIGIMLVDREGRIEEVNHRLLEVLGSPSAEATKAVNVLTFPRLVESGISEVFRRCMEEGIPITAEMPYVSKWDKPCYLRLVLTPRIGKDGRVVGCQGVAEDIADRKRAEDAILRVKNEWEQTFDVVPDLLMILDKGHRIVRVNQATLQALGLTKEEVMGNKCYRVIHDTHEPPDYCPCAKMFRDGLPHQSEYSEARLGGTFHVSASPLREPDGVLKGCVHVARDITNRKKNEELILTQRNLSIALAGTSDFDRALKVSLDAALHVSDMDTAVIYLANEDGSLDVAAHKGVPHEALRSSRHIPADSPKVSLLLAHEPAYLKVDDSLRETTIPGGEGLLFEAVVPVQYEGRTIACFCLGSRSLEDIPVRTRHALETTVAQVAGAMARMRAELALRESETNYRDLFENARDLVYTHDLNGDYTSVNTAAETLLGYALRELLTMNFREIVDAEYLAVTEANFQKKIAGEAEITGPYEVLVRSKDGTPVWLEVTSRILKRDGVAYGVHGTARDVTDRKRAEQLLKESEHRYRTLVETVPLGIVEIDPGGAIIFANEAYFRMHGYQAEELMGKSIMDLRPTESEKIRLREYLERLVRDKPSPEPWIGRDLKKDGTVIDVQSDWGYKSNPQGEVVGFIAVITDITRM